MFLPNRLTASTLGDVLGALHRARITGVVELREVSGVTPGRRHAISLAEGMVTEVETPLAPVATASLAARLDTLFALRDASIRFSVARSPAAAPRLVPREFLHGRPRARDRAHRATMPPPPLPPPPRPAEPAEARAARAVLGVDAAAPEDEIRRAFRRLAREHHPDRVAAVSPVDAERARLRLAAITAAYHTLTRAS
jgi:DnaJ domain